jgi:hypothetical protein
VASRFKLRRYLTASSLWLRQLAALGEAIEHANSGKEMLGGVAQAGCPASKEPHVPPTNAHVPTPVGTGNWELVASAANYAPRRWLFPPQPQPEQPKPCAAASSVVSAALFLLCSRRRAGILHLPYQDP